LPAAVLTACTAAADLTSSSVAWGPTGSSERAERTCSTPGTELGTTSLAVPGATPPTSTLFDVRSTLETVH
jgi:hypothetical protein